MYPITSVSFRMLIEYNWLRIVIKLKIRIIINKETDASVTTFESF